MILRLQGYTYLKEYISIKMSYGQALSAYEKFDHIENWVSQVIDQKSNFRCITDICL